MITVIIKEIIVSWSSPKMLRIFVSTDWVLLTENMTREITKRENCIITGSADTIRGKSENDNRDRVDLI